MNYSKNIFDYRKLSSEVKKQLKLDLGPNDVFTNKIRELFSIAKEQNIKDLSPDQITVAYYRKYTKENKKDIKMDILYQKIDILLHSTNTITLQQKQSLDVK